VKCGGCGGVIGLSELVSFEVERVPEGDGCHTEGPVPKSLLVGPGDHEETSV